MFRRKWTVCVMILVVMDTCISRQITVRPFYLCGKPHMIYFLGEHLCVNGTLVPLISRPPKSTSSPSSPSSSSLSTDISVPELTTPIHAHAARTSTKLGATGADAVAQRPWKTPGPTCERKETVTDCSPRTRLCGGYQCCGNNATYHPGFSTCCTVMFKSRVFDGKARDHVCCRGIAVPRGKHTCLSADANDRLWKDVSRFKPKAYESLCYADFVYLVKSIKSNSRDGIRRIVLRELLPSKRATKGIQRQSVRRRRTIEMPLATDEYTPTRILPKGKLILLTSGNRMSEKTFYLYRNDRILRMKKNWRKDDRFLAQLKKCRRLLRKNNVFI